MAWPLPSEIRAALLDPRTAFRDPRLQACALEKTEAGELLIWTGSSAVVYKALLPDGTPLALRTFSADSHDRCDRYGWIARYLDECRLGCLVNFQYHDSGIRLPGTDIWYPVMVMDWVEGAPLFHYIRTRCLEGKASSMAKAARHWVAIIQELTAAKIVHGDLEPANVLVTKAGKLKLVDYDTMCVPALLGLPSLEVSIEPYRHPRRITTTPLSPELDNFAALVTYTALRALAAAPGLWAKHVEQWGRNSLLFHGDDFRDPEASSLLHDLKRSPDREVRRLAKIVFKAAAAKLSEVPPLAEVLAMISHAAIAKVPARAPGDAVGTQVAPHGGNAPSASSGPKVVLQVTSGPIQGQQFVFDRHDTFLLGRGEDCHAQICGDMQVSRHHFLLEAVPPHVRIRDLGSRNGTFVNGQRYGNSLVSDATEAAAPLHPVEADLKPGDRITVGRTTIELRIEPSLPTTAATEVLEYVLSPQQPAVETGPGLAAYEIGEAVGSGPLGTVCRATRKSDGMVVAVKIVKPAVAVSAAEGARFLQSIEPLRKLQHPGIVNLLEMGWAGEYFYFVTRYCSGTCLSEAMAGRRGCLTPAEAKPLLLQSLAALAYAHEQGIVHGDLKPQNVLLDSRGGSWFALLGDFGMAKQLELAGLSGLTATCHARLGHGFMPREQLTGFQNCLPASDLWSLAGTFYFALSGQYPYDFQDRDPLAVILHDEPVPLAQRNPQIPPLAAAAIDIALHTDPAARYPSATAMLVAVEQAFAQAAGGLR
jgi:serine/threonine protein kinase